MSENTQPIQPPGARSADAEATHVGIEQRRHERNKCRRALTVYVLEGDGTEAREREILVKSIDLSRGGVGFNHRQYLYPGTAVRVCFHTLPKRPVIKGVVVNCRHMEGAMHRIGVRFELNSH